MIDKINFRIKESLEVKEKVLKDKKIHQEIHQIVLELVKTLKTGGRILFCGNGGSAADAQHLAAELSGKFYLDRAPLDAEALHVNTSYLTAAANDFSYDEVFDRILKAKARYGDVLIGLSTSGNSNNIVRAYEEAKRSGVKIVSLTGAGGGKMKEHSDYILEVPSKDVPRIQEVHILLGHIICELTEAEIFGKPDVKIETIDDLQEKLDTYADSFDYS